jgi:hypothetical protein
LPRSFRVDKAPRDNPQGVPSQPEVMLHSALGGAEEISKRAANRARRSITRAQKKRKGTLPEVIKGSNKEADQV